MSGVVLAWRELPFPGELPAVDGLVDLPDANNYYGSSVFKNSVPLNKGLNKTFSSSIAAADKANAQVLGISGVADVKALKASDIAGSDIKGVGVQNAQARFQTLDFASVQQAIQSKAAEQFVQAYQLTTNQGVNQPVANFSREVQQSMAFEVASYDSKRNRVSQALGRAAVLELRMMQHYWSVEDLQLVMPGWPVEAIKKFKDADLRTPTVVQVKQTSVFLGNPTLRFEFFKMFAQAPKELIAQYMDESQIRELFNFSDSLGRSELQRHIDKAECENEMILGGTKGIECHSLEPHQIHIQTHLRIIADPDRDSPEMKPIVIIADVHIQRHLDELKKQQAAQLQQVQAMAMAENAGKQQAQPQPQPGPQGQGA
jgi:hypothetical protein